MSTKRLCLWFVITALILVPTGLALADGPADEGIESSVGAALVWLVGQPQNAGGFLGSDWISYWSSCDRLATNGVIVTRSILGTEELDVMQIDPASVTLAGVAPLRWALGDVATPFEPYIERESTYDCGGWGQDSFLDITFTFDAAELAAALGDVNDGDVLLLPLEGHLFGEFGGAPIVGEDVILIVKKNPELTTLTLGAGLAFVASLSTPISIDGGPVYVPPGAGTESYSDPFTPARAAGATVTQEGYDLTQTANLWFGLRVDTGQNGYSMNGIDLSAGEVFRYWGMTSNSIEYRGETELVTTCPAGTYQIATRMIFTFTGTGVTVRDDTTIGLNDPVNGDVGVLWHVQSSDFSIDISIEAQVPQFDPNAGNWEPANDLFNRLQYLCPAASQTGLSIDWGFYYEVSEIFADGFESGNTNAWSSTVPAP